MAGPQNRTEPTAAIYPQSHLRERALDAAFKLVDNPKFRQEPAAESLVATAEKILAFLAPSETLSGSSSGPDLTPPAAPDVKPDALSF